MLVAEMNPCPCGYYGDPVKECTDLLANVLRYQKRISGPLLDRIDIHIEVPRVEYEKLAGDRTGETDVEILSTTNYLIRQPRLSRTYFSALGPVPDTPLENRAAENPRREYRLYQSSFLIRDYGFDMEEMPFDQRGNLPLDVDPKVA